MPDMSFAIDLPGRNDWDNVELLRGAIQSCVSAMFSSVDRSHTLAMIVGELLENAVKYGDWSDGSHWFRLRVWGEDGRTFVCVQNPVKDAADGDVANVMATIAWIKGFESSEEAYRAKLLEIAARPSGTKMSQLGLVRISYEGDCTLSASVEDSTLRVTARIERPVD